MINYVVTLSREYRSVSYFTVLDHSYDNWKKCHEHLVTFEKDYAHLYISAPDNVVACQIAMNNLEEVFKENNW